MVVPFPPPSPEDYRRLWWRAVRRELGRTAVALALAVPGLVAGLWFTDAWKSEWVATQVVWLSAVGAVLVGHFGWRLVARVRGRPRPRPEPSQMLRTILRGEASLVTPPHRAAGVTVVLVGVVAWLAIATVAVRTGALRPDRVLVLVPLAALAASNLVGLVGYRLGPRLALFADRIEIRRGLGRYLVPWSAVVAAGKRDERVVFHLSQGSSTRRRGWIRPQPAYGVPVGDLGMSADAAISTIERCQRDFKSLGRQPGPALP
jgi:hypothetical protein